ncbi:bifunctional adenosylcobinamide kinase/adenosylcobinamide-phosphate guanylyltransferase [Halomonas sp. V046]|uniref:bifunctional adenosylcobinamide kinase/adenosylcobinamide-phosphate guanylyltransferase n=1 Tax=Halomonas sp. V046 TaxID=3459611 RepID=UPI004043B423
MQLFLGGACAGKRERVDERFPGATWSSAQAAMALLERGDAPATAAGVTESPASAVGGPPQAVWVIHGWLAWLEAQLDGGSASGDDTGLDDADRDNGAAPAPAPATDRSRLLDETRRRWRTALASLATLPMSGKAALPMAGKAGLSMSGKAGLGEPGRGGEAGAIGEIVLIIPEVGRGIVPMDARERQLRDLAGWLAQDASAACTAVWYVRHGLVMALKAPPG